MRWLRTIWRSAECAPSQRSPRSAPGVSPFPSPSYERNGWLVSMTVTGVSGKAEIDAWNAKQLKLERFP